VIKEITKDVTTVEEGLVLHGCNCVGGFGSGVAGAIRRKWPTVYETFKKNGIGEHLLGTIDGCIISEEPPLAIFNGYTQVNCGNDGKRYANVDAVEACMLQAAQIADDTGLPLYMPKLGCGLGGLSWEDEIKPLTEKVSLEFPDVNIFICDL